MTTKTILGVIPGLQATALVGHSIRMSGFGSKRPQSYRKQTRNMVRGSMGLMTGIALIKPTSQMINEM